MCFLYKGGDTIQQNDLKILSKWFPRSKETSHFPCLSPHRPRRDVMRARVTGDGDVLRMVLLQPFEATEIHRLNLFRAQGRIPRQGLGQGRIAGHSRMEGSLMEKKTILPRLLEKGNLILCACFSFSPSLSLSPFNLIHCLHEKGPSYTSKDPDPPALVPKTTRLCATRL